MRANALLHDYDALVESRPLEKPAGWHSLATFLERSHRSSPRPQLQAHPCNSRCVAGATFAARGGARASLVARAFPSIESAVQRHVRRLGKGAGPAIEEHGGGRHHGAWSVRLSSAGITPIMSTHGGGSLGVYIALPPGTARAREIGPTAPGWLRWGGRESPPIRRCRHRFVKPEAGSWSVSRVHVARRRPFQSDKPRLSVAFDVVP